MIMNYELWIMNYELWIMNYGVIMNLIEKTYTKLSMLYENYRE